MLHLTHLISKPIVLIQQITNLFLRCFIHILIHFFQPNNKSLLRLIYLFFLLPSQLLTALAFKGMGYCLDLS